MDSLFTKGRMFAEVVRWTQDGKEFCGIIEGRIGNHLSIFLFNKDEVGFRRILKTEKEISEMKQ